VRNQNFLLSYIDLLMNLSITFAAIFMLSVMLINRPVKAQHAVDERARLLVVMTWDPQSADDLDLWLKTPGGEKVGYTHPNGLIANLQRDDMGPINDYIELPDGKRQYRRFNQEITTIRSLAEGHYVVNVEFFRRHPDPETGRRSQGAVKCTVELIQVDPSYRQLEQRSVTLAEAGDEETAFSFNISNNAQIQDLSYAREGFVL
jgi:hypothetical protein